jgi:hypothetical protein
MGRPGTFQRGHDPRRNVTEGRPPGNPKKGGPSARELALLERERSMQKLIALRDGAQDETIQLRAAIYLLDRADGRPPSQPILTPEPTDSPESDGADILKLLAPMVPEPTPEPGLTESEPAEPEMT